MAGGMSGHEWEEEPTAVTELVGDPPDAAPGARQAYLLVMAGTNLGEMIKVSAEPMIIGRSRTAGLRLLDEGVSREHARLDRDGADLVIHDIDSRNGTFINGERIDRHVLAEGDRIQLGCPAILKLVLAGHLEDA